MFAEEYRPSRQTASVDSEELSKENAKGPLFDGDDDNLRGKHSYFETESDVDSDDEESFVRPRSWYLNLGAAYLHTAQAIVMVMLYLVRTASWGGRFDVVYPLAKSYSLWESEAPYFGAPAAHPGCTTPASIRFGSQQVSLQRIDAGQALSLNWLIFGFFFLSAVFQGAAPLLEKLGVYPYTKFVQEVGIHPLRFVEYAISASIMLVAIGLQVGITDADILWAIGVLTGTCMMCGLLAELCIAYMQPEYRQICAWIAHVSGWPPCLTAYSMILRFFSDSQNSCGGGGSSPSFLYAILITEFVFFTGFAVVQFVQIAKLDKVNKEHIETAYVVQSLISKTVLCWSIYGSVLVQSFW